MTLFPQGSIIPQRRKNVATTTKNITRHRDYVGWSFHGSLDQTYYLRANDGGEMIEVTLQHRVQLPLSPGMAAWMNRNCKGWYDWYDSLRDCVFYFEHVNDAIFAKLRWS